ncbi:MAG: adenosylcobinamide-phosphate synthase CbiB [Ilumatobacteraceae bacterium]
MSALLLTAPSVGLVGDALVGEPPATWHPVAWFGSVMARAEAAYWSDDRRAGVAHLVIGVGLANMAATGLDLLLGRRVAAAVATSVALGGGMLGSVANDVAGSLERGDLPTARSQLRSLVGRDPSSLDEVDIVRAVVESVAENTVDAVTATLWWAALGGASGALLHRAVNTLDAMVGHRTARYDRFGWASARADDAANWIPARLTVLAVAAVRPRRARAVWRVVRRDHRNHPSPNGGVVEAAFAGALGVRLSGVNDYGGSTERRGPLGDGCVPARADIRAAVRLSRDVAWLTALVPAVVGATIWADGARRERGRK